MLLGIATIVVAARRRSVIRTPFWAAVPCASSSRTCSSTACRATPEFDSDCSTRWAPAVGLGRRAGDCCSRMCAVFLARRWQASAGPARRVRCRISHAATRPRARRGGGACSSVLSIWLDNALIDEIAIVFFAALLLIGLAAAHRYRAQSGLHVVWLWVIYIGLVRGDAADGGGAGRLGICRQLVALASGRRVASRA